MSNFSMRELVRLIAAGTSWRRHLELINRDIEDRAIRLLVENLNPAQRRQFEGRGCFEVIGAATGSAVSHLARGSIERRRRRRWSADTGIVFQAPRGSPCRRH